MPENTLEQRVNDIEYTVKTLTSNVERVINAFEKMELREEKRTLTIFSLDKNYESQTKMMEQMQKAIEALLSSQETMFNVGLPICSKNNKDIERYAKQFDAVDKKFDKIDTSISNIYKTIDAKVSKLLYTALGILSSGGLGVLVYHLTKGS